MKTTKTLSLYALLSSLFILLLSPKSDAHGYLDFPKARQAICEAQGGYWWPADGSNMPNAACRAAFLESGHVQFIQEHEFSVNVRNYNSQTAVQNSITNGTLCSAGSQEKRGINLPSPFWQRTEVTPNADNELAIRFRATTPHNPSFWKFYISKASHNGAEDPLTWQDLELVTEISNVDFVKDPDGKRFYEMKINIPADREGDAILYTRWQRIDVVGEGFYNCSDITIVRDSLPSEWLSAGFFVKQGQDAKVTDTVWARVFDENGQELINQSLKIDSSNQSNWQTQLAQTLNSDFSNTVKIGIKQTDGTIVFDAQNLLSNEVYVKDTDHTYNLTIEVQKPNTPPTVNTPDPIQMDELTTVTLHIHAFDDEQQALIYTWELPQGLTFTGSGSTIEIAANDVTTDANYVGKVTVSDGFLSTAVEINITVKHIDSSTYPKWLRSKTYVAGNKVSHNGKNYEAKWWTRGQVPGNAQVWKKIN